MDIETCGFTLTLKDWYKRLRGRVGWLACIVLLIVVYYPDVHRNFREAAVRDSHSLERYAQLGGTNLLHEYRNRFGKFPPVDTSGTVYLPLTAELVQPVVFDALSTQTSQGRSSLGTVLYSGPPIDPYRLQLLFPNESKVEATALGNDGRVTRRGYPLRYARIGTWALLISNGPDQDADITLDKVRKYENRDGEALFDFVKGPHAYDTTNVTLSSGDCVRIVDPDRKW